MPKRVCCTCKKPFESSSRRAIVHCGRCSTIRMSQNIEQLRGQKGTFYEAWREGLKGALKKLN